jgi:hypothetical protein
VQLTPAFVRPTDTLVILKNPLTTAVWRDGAVIHAVV